MLQRVPCLGNSLAHATGHRAVWIVATGQHLAHHDGSSWPGLAGGDCYSEQNSKCRKRLVVEDLGVQRYWALSKASAV